MCDEITDITDGVPREILPQFLKILGVNVRHNEFDSNIDDRELRSPFHPERVLVSLKGKLVGIEGVFSDGCVEFVLFAQGAVRDSAFGGCGVGVVAQGKVKADMASAPCCGAYRGANFFHLFPEVVDIFRVWIPGEGVKWFFHHDGAHSLIDGRGGGSVGHFYFIC